MHFPFQALPFPCITLSMHFIFQALPFPCISLSRPFPPGFYLLNHFSLQAFPFPCISVSMHFPFEAFHFLGISFSKHFPFHEFPFPDVSLSRQLSVLCFVYSYMVLVPMFYTTDPRCVTSRLPSSVSHDRALVPNLGWIDYRTQGSIKKKKKLILHAKLSP